MEDYRTYLKNVLFNLKRGDRVGAAFQLGYACAVIENGDAAPVYRDHAHREFYRRARRTDHRVRMMLHRDEAA